MTYRVPKVLPTTVVGSYPKFPIAKEALKVGGERRRYG
jgi:methionine synthase II (cobalamin-independent)